VSKFFRGFRVYGYPAAIAAVVVEAGREVPMQSLRWFRMSVALSGSLFLWACGDGRSPAVPSSLDDGALLPEAATHAPPVATPSGLLVSVDWLAEHRGRPNVAVLHVGTAAAYNAGHVPGAWFVDLAALQSTQNGIPVMLNPPDVLRGVLEAAGVATSQHVIVTGDGPLQAARAFFILEYLGHPSVHLLDGGRAAWQAAFGLSTGSAVAERPGRLATPVRADRLATADWVEARLGDPRVVLLDARPAVNFAVSRIPGASSLPWTQLVESTAMPRVRSVPELRTLFAEAGTDTAHEVVAYCSSGMMSSVSYFVARYLGHNVRLYDGSMLEWTALGLPLEP
jgi:thiosulfate/3-mercaptopyruvate sulfurtransferase